MYRKPNFEYNFPDNDAVWYLNPVDLKNFLKSNNCEIVCYQNLNHIKNGKSELILFIAKIFPEVMGITRIIAKKL